MELRRRLADQGLVERVRGREGVVDAVPVAGVVVEVEAGDAQRGGEGERPAELLGRATGADRVEQRAHDQLGVVVEEGPAQLAGVDTAAVATCARGQRGRQLLLRPGHQAGEVVGVVPLATFLAAVGGARLADHRRHDARVLGPDQRNALEGLVREVEGVTLVDEHVVGGGREHHPLRGGEVPRVDHGRQRPLGRVGRPSLHEAPVPAGHLLEVVVAVAERRLREAGRAPPRVPADEGERVDEGQWPVGRVERGEQVGHGHEHGQPGSPACVAIGRPVVEGLGHDRLRTAGLQQPERGLGHDEGDALLEPVAQPSLEPAHGIGLRAGRDEDGAVVDGHVEADRVVGPRVERAPAGQIEAGVVPVARHEAGLDRALVEGEPEVGAAILDGEGPTAVPHDEHRERADLCEQAAIALQIVQRTGPDRVLQRHVPSLAPGAEFVKPRLV